MAPTERRATRATKTTHRLPPILMKLHVYWIDDKAREEYYQQVNLACQTSTQLPRKRGDSSFGIFLYIVIQFTQ